MVAFVQKAVHFGWGKYRNYRKINMDVRVHVIFFNYVYDGYRSPSSKTKN